MESITIYSVTAKCFLVANVRSIRTRAMRSNVKLLRPLVIPVTHHLICGVLTVFLKLEVSVGTTAIVHK